jgi:hypothetical protein
MQLDASEPCSETDEFVQEEKDKFWDHDHH